MSSPQVQPIIDAQWNTDFLVLEEQEAKIKELEAKIAELENAEPPSVPQLLPSISVSDVLAIPETAGTAVFTVSLDAASDYPVMVHYTTVAGTATADADFAMKSGTLTFAPGERSQTVTVQVINDPNVEPVETFTLQLSNARFALVIADAVGVASIVSEDVTPPPPPPVPTGAPSTLAFMALTSNAERAAYIASVEAWYKANTGPRTAITTTRAGGSIAGTFRNMRFTGPIRPAAGTALIDCQVDGYIDADGKRITLDHCRIDGKGASWAVLGNPIASYCDIFNAEDAIKTQNDGWQLTWNYIHGPYTTSSSHNDGVQIQWRNTNGLIESNWVQWRDTSELFAQIQSGEPINNLMWRWNWLGGSDLPIRIEQGCTNCSVIENVVKRGNWGYMDLISSVVKRGNVDWITGTAI